MPSRTRQRYPMPFGPGFDRETGTMAVQPGTMEDLRNVYLHEGKVSIRGGFTNAITFAEADTVVAGRMLKSERVLIVVGYNSPDETVHVFRVAVDGSEYQHLGEWTHDQGGWGSAPPVILMAESYGRMFMADNALFVTERAQTLYYDPLFGASLLNLLEADLEGAGDEPVRFRGVVRHINYLFGWGFGSESNNRPELVRASKPGEPDLFEAGSYFIAGDRREPVTTCIPSGRELLTFKESETYRIIGSEKNDFGIVPLDPAYGIVGARLGVNYSGWVVGWSAEGPRTWLEGTPSEDLELPLDLQGWEPSDLVAAGALSGGFAAYVPGRRVIVFVFDRRVYALTVKRPGDWKWSYWELGFTPECAFSAITGGILAGEIAGPPTGHPEYDSANTTNIAGTWLDVEVDNVDQDGDEVLELWLKPDGGAWTLWGQANVQVTADQTVRLGANGGKGSDLTPGTDYDIALRYRRGTQYATAYSDADPALWPSVSRGSFSTTIDPPTIDDCVWSRNSDVEEQILLTVTPAAGQEGNDIEIRRDGALIHTESAPAGQFTFADTGITGEELEDYDARTLGTSQNSPYTDVHECWAGPAPIPAIDWVEEYTLTGASSYQVAYTPGDETLDVELWDDYDTATDTVGAFPQDLRDTETPTGPGTQLIEPTAPIGGASPPVNATIEVGVRHKQTQFTVDDYGQFATQPGVFLCQSEGVCS